MESGKDWSELSEVFVSINGRSIDVVVGKALMDEVEESVRIGTRVHEEDDLDDCFCIPSSTSDSPFETWMAYKTVEL